MQNNEEQQCCATACGLPLNANYWDQQYKINETGWDLNQISPPLKSYIDTLNNKNIGILIPGCGNAYEAEYLLQQGFTNITLIDISLTLVTKLKEKFRDQAIRILHGDFFEHTEKYDLILEQTFFCALNPSLRERYAAKTFKLLKEHGKVAGLLFNIIFQKEGPPFGGTKDEYTKLFVALYRLKQFDVCPNSVKTRDGNELFIEIEKRNINEDFVKLYAVSGIHCTGCKNTITDNLLKINGVLMASINTDLSEVLVVTDVLITESLLQQAMVHDSKYKLHTINF